MNWKSLGKVREGWVRECRWDWKHRTGRRGTGMQEFIPFSLLFSKSQYDALGRKYVEEFIRTFQSSTKVEVAWQ